MFTSARFKLTAWYVLIMAVITGFFSVVAYKVLTHELDRSLRIQAYRIDPIPEFRWEPGRGWQSLFEADPWSHMSVVKLHPEVLEEAKRRILWRIVLADVIILSTSGLASFYLAGETLRPIELMVEDQKRFIGDASHELRTPLTTMKTEIEVALREKELSLSQAKELLDSSLEEVNKMQDLTNYLLSLSRYQQISLSKEIVSLDEVVKSVCEGLKLRAEAKQIKLKEGITPVKIQGNGVALGELAAIVLDNAIKYSPQNSEVEVSLKKHKLEAVLEVRDQGAGIKPSELPYIFNRFYRADSSRSKEKVQGYGLGLAIAKNIVELHQGKIRVQSKPGNGSVFIVNLPINKS